MQPIGRCKHCGGTVYLLEYHTGDKVEHRVFCMECHREKRRQ